MGAQTKTWIAVVIASGLVAGCDGSKSIPLEDLGDATTQRICAQAAACGGTPDEATCKATLFIESGSFPTLVAAVNRGTVTYDGRKAAECLDSLGTVCERPTDDPASCDETFVGRVPAGGACVLDEECVNDADCVFPVVSTGGCRVGVCGAASLTVPIGGTCSDPDTRCASGAYCDASSTCSAQLGPGAPCSGFDNCQAPYICDLAASGVSTECALPAASGAACVSNRLVPCARTDEYCEPSTSRCTHRKLPGEPCAANCVAYARCVNQICVTRGTVGQTCGPVINTCQGSLICTGEVCTVPGPSPVCTP